MKERTKELEEREEMIKKLNNGIVRRLSQRMEQVTKLSLIRDKVRKVPDVSTGLNLILDTAIDCFNMDTRAILILDKSWVRPTAFKSRMKKLEGDEN